MGQQASRLPALSNVYESTAEAGWRAIDFISDLHLSEATPRTFERWQRYLIETPADAVFILGDLLEVWIGDDSRVPGSFAQRAADVLHDAAAQRPLHFMVGNRDFLVGAGMLRDCGVTALSDPTVLDAWGQRVLLTHGDALCLDDTDYQAFRALVRQPSWRDAVLARPLAEREALARKMRDASQAAKRGKPVPDWADVDAAPAVAWMHAAGARTMIHGHTHRPGSDVLAPGHVRWVLSDWDCDAEPHRAQALRLTRDGLARVDLLHAR
jgi:UDP-2,3-diacylglucosamine hydrolase